MIRLAIAEDNVFLSKSLVDNLASFPDIKVKHVASNGVELLSLLAEDPMVDAVLMDIEMPNMDGISCTLQLHQKYPQIKIIMLTVFEDDDNLFRAIQAGASGYMIKDEPVEKIYDAIKDVLSGGAPMSSVIALKTLRLLRDRVDEVHPPKEYHLTKRETQILEQLCQGKTYTEIADNLIISPKTVRKHIENVYTKLEVHSKLEAVDLARRNRLV